MSEAEDRWKARRAYVMDVAARGGVSFRVLGDVFNVKAFEAELIVQEYRDRLARAEEARRHA